MNKTKNRNIKNLYSSDLRELNFLICRIKNEIDMFSHVSEYLPKTLINEINKFQKNINDEFDRRNEILYQKFITTY